MKKIMLWMTVSFICGLLVLPFAVKSQPSARYGYMMPPGSILTFAGINCPDGFLKADGTSVPRATYSKLFTAIGTLHGTADANSFNLPDYRGRFLRGVDGGSGRDEDRAARTAMNPGGETGDSVGTVQADNNKGHQHYVASSAHHPGAEIGVSNLTNSTYIARDMPNNNAGLIQNYSFAAVSHAADVGLSSVSGGSESRPENAAVTYCIKY